MSTAISAFASVIGDRASYTNTDILGTVTTQPVSLVNKYQMNYGATASDANNTTTLPTKYYEGQHSITIASSTYDIDLTALVDVYGNSFATLSKIYKIIVVNNDLTGGSGLILKGNATNGWVALFNGLTTGQQLIQAGGRYMNESPYAGFNVTAGSKVLRIQNDAASPSGAASFNLHLWGS